MKQTGTLPASRLRAPALVSSALERLGRGVNYGELTIETPPGERIEFVGSEPLPGAAVWKLNNWKPLWALATRGAMGLAESYLEGDWDSPIWPGFFISAPSMNARSVAALKELRPYVWAIAYAIGCIRIRWVGHVGILPIITTLVMIFTRNG